MENKVQGKVLKKILIAMVCVLVIGGAGLGVYAYASKNSNEETVSAYREYSVEKGSITVGTSESGTISIDRSYITLPVSAEVEEVYVKVGSVVEEGDKLAKLNVEDIDSLKEQYELQLSQAKLELEAAVTSAEEKKVQAKQNYDSTLEKSASAESSYNLSITQINNNLSDAEKNLESLKTQLAEIEALNETYPDDYAVLAAYEEKLEEYNAVYKEYQTVYSGYEKVMSGYQTEQTELKKKYSDYTDEISETYNDIKSTKEAYEKAKTTLTEAKIAYDKAYSEYLEAIASDDSDLENITKTYKSAATAYENAMENLETAEESYTHMYKSLDITYSKEIEKYEASLEEIEDKIYDYQKMMDSYSDKMKDYNDMISEYREEYEEYKSDFTDIYGNYDDEGLADKIESLTDDIANAEYNIEKLNANKSGDTLSAQQQLESAVVAGTTAESVYNQAIAEIENNLRTKQDSYDKMVEEYDEFIENIGDGVYIYADCDGSVAEVNITEGSTFMSNQTLVSLTDPSGIYVSVSVSEDDISSLYVGQESSVVLSAYENVTLEAEIDTIAVEPSRSSGSVSYAVTVKVTPNENITIYEGMSAEVTFLQKQVTDVLYVNANAVSYKGNGISTVLVYDESGNAVEKEVKTGFSDGRYVEITEGLSVGDRVLAESAVSLA